MSDEVFHKNQIRESIKNFFADLDCFTLARPLSNEQQLAHIEDMPYDTLKPEFRTALDSLMAKLKSPDTCRVKSINGKTLNSSMLLGIAMEYVDAINNQEIPVVMNCFERVIQVESRRFAEKLFEEITQKIRQECDESLMPFEECADGNHDSSTMDSILEHMIAYADKRISEKLGEVANVETLIDLREDFECRLRAFFKEIKHRNKDVSEYQCSNVL